MKGKKMEQGNLIVDQLSSIIVMAFMFAMLLAYVSSSKLVQMRLAIDNIAKEYLYQMEQKGLLTGEMMGFMKDDLAAIGIYEDSIVFDGTSHTGTTQAAYGDKVTLKCTVTFPNPIYTLLSAETRGNGRPYELDENGNPTNPEGTMFTLGGISPTITYTANMSATAKW